MWVSRDTGATWTNVTAKFPRGAPTDCFVSTIVASRFADGTAYVTYDCHNRDEYRPHAYRTADFGRTWAALGTAGLPADGGSYTIVEDAENPRLLWLGTEVGAYVTVDAGARWYRFGKNLPPVPVEKMAESFRQKELVVSTHGRGMWVAEIAPLQEMTDSLLAQPAYLFRIAPALQYRYADTYPSFGSRPFVSPNPPRGARIFYWLKEAQPGPVNMLITTAAGDTVKALKVPGYAGLQAATWDLSRDKPRPREKGGPTSTAELKRVLPGDYVVHLTVGKLKMQQPVKVQAWPADTVGWVR